MEEMVTLEFQITKKALDALKAINDAGFAEFRDPEHKSLDEFKASNGKQFMSVESFKNRNFCDLYLIEELDVKGLVESDGVSWHLTYVVTPFGKQILEANKNK